MEAIVHYGVPDLPEGWCREFLDSLPAALCRITHDGRPVFMNRAMVRMLGFGTFEGLKKKLDVVFDRKFKGRDNLLHLITENGAIENFPVVFTGSDNRPVDCVMTSRGIFDAQDRLTHIDGVVREAETYRLGIVDRVPSPEKHAITDFILLLDKTGIILSINGPGAALLGFPEERLIGKSIFDFIIPLYKEVFSILLSTLPVTGREEGLITVMDVRGTALHLEFLAALVKGKGGSSHVQIIARNVTRRINNQRKRLSEEKMTGVLEMAGGVAHQLNQPLTIVGNLVQDILSHLNIGDDHYLKIKKIQEQVDRLNNIARKVGRIRKYEAMDYLAGAKIVDIDRAS